MKNKGFMGALIIIAVAVVGLAALVAFGILDVGKLKKTSTPATTSEVPDMQINQLNTLSTSDNVADIQKDLDSTNFASVDQEMPQVSQQAEGLGD